MTGLAIYREIKRGSYNNSIDTYINECKLKDLLNSELRCSNVRTFDDVSTSVCSLIDNVDFYSLSEFNKMSLLMCCFDFIEESEKLLHPELPHSTYRITESLKYKTLYDVGNSYISSLSQTYGGFNENLKRLSRAYYIKKIDLVRVIINKVELICQ